MIGILRKDLYSICFECKGALRTSEANPRSFYKNNVIDDTGRFTQIRHTCPRCGFGMVPNLKAPEHLQLNTSVFHGLKYTILK